jgi:hypothetical protein
MEVTIMANEITEAFVKQYADNFIQKSQQMKSRLEQHVLVDSGIVGASKSVDRIGATEDQQRTERYGDSPNAADNFERRWIDLSDWEWGKLIDDMDKLKMLADPTSPVIAGGVASLMRRKDKVIIAALGGSARQGEGASATTVALPAGQKIAHGSAGMTIAKVITARGLLGRNEAFNEEDPNDELVMVYSMEQLENMLNIDKVTSADYNSIKALVTGALDTWMGFKWVRSQLLPKVAYERFCYAYCKSGMTLGIGKDATTKLGERPDKKFIPYAYAKQSVGAVRGEDVKVVEISCNEIVSA